MARKTMNARSKWKKGLFERLNGLTSCRFFHEWNEWKNLQRVRPFGLEKRPFFHEDLAFIVLSANSIMTISNNVEHECLRFSLRIRVYYDLKGFFKLAFKASKRITSCSHFVFKFAAFLLACCVDQSELSTQNFGREALSPHVKPALRCWSITDTKARSVSQRLNKILLSLASCRISRMPYAAGEGWFYICYN